MGVAQNERARVTAVLVFVSIFLGNPFWGYPMFDPQPMIYHMFDLQGIPCATESPHHRPCPPKDWAPFWIRIGALLKAICFLAVDFRSFEPQLLLKPSGRYSLSFRAGLPQKPLRPGPCAAQKMPSGSIPGKVKNSFGAHLRTRGCKISDPAFRGERRCGVAEAEGSESEPLYADFGTPSTGMAIQR